MNKFNEKKEREREKLFLNKLNSCFRSAAATTTAKSYHHQILFNFK